MRRRRVAAEDETVAVPPGEWPVPAEGPPPPVPPPDAGPPPQGPPRGWLAVENPWPWLLLVLLPVAALLIWLFAVRQSDRATVPRVVGLSQPAAIKRLNDKGFDVTAVRRPGKAPAGVVFSQSPGAGSQLKKKQTVRIDVSNGVVPKTAAAPAATTGPSTTTVAAPQVAVPNVTGKAQAEAGAAIETVGLVPDTFPAAASDPSGTVVSQVPAAGTKLPAGKSVRLNVSTGGGNQPAVSIPDVTGQKAADARAKLWAAKLTVRTVYEHGTVGVVLRQEPAGATQGPAFSQVTIVVGR